MDELTKRAIIINTGTEILLGNIVSTNSAFIAKELANIGIDCYKIVSIGDNLNRLKQEILAELDKNDIFILTGGLGGTVDDITKEAVSDALEISLVFDKKIEDEIRKKYEKKGINFKKTKEANVFKNGLILRNEIGSAPGFIIEKNKKIFILLPGVPHEMKKMFLAVQSYLKEHFNENLVIRSKVLRCMGLKEIEINEKIKEIFNKSRNPTIALLAIPGEVSIRLTAKGNEKVTDKLLGKMQSKFEKIFKGYIWGYDDEKIEEKLGNLLNKNGLTIAGAESCTGGLVAKLFTDISGSSKYFLGSVVTYSNSSKSSLLGVAPETIEKYGVVSKEAALEMVEGVKRRFRSDIGYAITGIAGPTGGSDKKPVGTVFVAYYVDNRVYWDRYNFNGVRDDIRRQAANCTLYKILKRLYL